MTPVDATHPALYPAHPRYRLYALVSALLVLLFAWDLRQGVELGGLLFLAITLGLLLWSARAAGSRVMVEERELRLHRPLAAATAVEFRQLAAVTEEGRMGQSILLHYHPLRGDGLVDLDTIHSLALPAVVGQAELAAQLAEKVPA